MVLTGWRPAGFLTGVMRNTNDMRKWEGEIRNWRMLVELKLGNWRIPKETQKNPDLVQHKYQSAGIMI